MSSTSISPLRRRMIEDMQARRLSETTQKIHLSSCARFAAFLGRSPETATADDIRRFQHHLSETGLSTITRNRIMTGVKFLVRVTLRRLDLANEIYHLSEPQTVPVVLSPTEIERLLKMARTPQRRVLLSLAYGCGLRAGEVVRLRVGDIDPEQGIIRIVQSKGRKDRNVMLPQQLLGLLRDWWRERPRRQDAGVAPEERWMFPGRSSGRPLTTRQVNRILHQTARAAGIRKPVTLHTLRHSFATHLLERGVDIRVIQALLGHSKLETTARYAQVATGMIAGIASPLDGLGGMRKKSGPA